MTVEQKQLLLAFLGYLKPEDVDNIWGNQTANATGEFQRAYGLEPDKIFGPATEARIREVIGNNEIVEPEKDIPEESTGTFWDHIRYWSPEEFKCRCGEYHAPYCNGFPVQPDQTLVELVDDIRHRAGAPGHRSSGIRCERHNTDSGGVYNSRHLTGKALDFFIEGLTGDQLLTLAIEDPRTNYAYVINPGEPYVHVDVK